jgi:hypothetical protein
MSKKPCRLPVIGGVATRAVFADLSAMLVDMAAYAITRKSQISPAKVLDENARACRSRDVIHLVTLFTRNACVLPGKRKAGLVVVHCFTARFPMDEVEISAIVVRMTLRAILTRAGRTHPDGMHPAALRHSLADLRVAFQTF